MNGVRLAVVALVLLVFAAPSSARPVQCGELLTQDTRLEADLDCPGDRGVLLGQGVTLDLHHHTITLNGRHLGVGVWSNQPGATVEKGRIVGVDDASCFAGVSAGRVTVRRVEIDGCTIGVDAIDSGNTIERNVLRAFPTTACDWCIRTGIRVGWRFPEATGNVVERNVINGFEVGIYDAPGTAALRGNVVR